MATLTNPNKLIRKAVFDLINTTVKTYDTRVPNENTETTYCIMSTQSKLIEKANKCDYYWDCELLLDIVDIYNLSGNSGSRVNIDNIENSIFNLIKNIQITGYEVLSRSYDFPSNLDNATDTQIVYRNFIRLRLLLNE